MPINQKNIVTEMESSYLDYAMTVIVARALPDVRDGLKPVHRRILVTMNDLGLRHTAKHRKSAKICGDVSGNYHPHGESIVYPSMVRLAQDFAMRYPLVDGQGNFGSVDGDNPAAMRYTEARMTKIAEEMLKDIEKKTVDFQDNYDSTRQEPKVLPTRLPQLLLNGTLGIAVGMATNIPPHNLTEICDGLIALIDKIPSSSLTSPLLPASNEGGQREEKGLTFNSEISIEELMQYIKGPDFPTGATIYEQQGLIDAYKTGRGKIIIRGTAEIVETKQGNSQILITEIPYQVNKSELVLKIAELVTSKKIQDISDIRDESDRKGIRIVIDLKKSAYPKKILNALYSQTALQTAFHFNTLALVNGIEPRVLNLKEILEEFVQFRHQVITRRSEFELTQAKDRAHILEGFLKALDIIDAVIETIRKSETRELALQALMTKFAFSDKQANAILDMRLSSLVGLERQKLEEEYKQKKGLIAYLEDLIANPYKIFKVIKDEIEEVKENYTDKRKTVIKQESLGSFKVEDVIPDEDVILTLTKTGYIKRVAINQYRNQGRGGKGILGMTTKDEDEIQELFIASTHETIYLFTNKGKVYRSKIYEIPAVSRQSKGIALQNIISIANDEYVTAIFTRKENGSEDSEDYIFMATVHGQVKKTAISAFKNVRQSGIVAITLQAGDKLSWVAKTKVNDLVIQVSEKGQCIAYQESNVRPMGRTASGVRGMKLRSEDHVVSTSIISRDDFPSYQLLVILENGFGKRTFLNQFDIQKRGGIGIKAANVTKKTGKVIEALIVQVAQKGSVVLMSRQGIVIKLKLKEIKVLGRVTQGVTLMKLKSGDKVASVAIVPSEEQST